jgi:hypothetical protein
MSEENSEKLLLEELKNAFEHIRFLDGKRNRFVIGIISASGAVLALIAHMLAENHLGLKSASTELIVILAVLCLSLSSLSYFLLRAYSSLSSVITNHEKVIAVVRSIMLDGKETRRITIPDTENAPIEKSLIEWLNVRSGRSDVPLSKLSEGILGVLCVLWLLSGITLFKFLLFRCQ